MNTIDSLKKILQNFIITMMFFSQKVLQVRYYANRRMKKLLRKMGSEFATVCEKNVVVIDFVDQCTYS